MNISDLQNAADYCRNSNFYRRKLAGYPHAISCIEDFQALPFTTKTEIRKTNPMEFVAVAPECIRRVHSSSGTKGLPSMTFYTDRDIVRWSDHLQRPFRSAGLHSGDVFQNMVGFGMFSGGLGFQTAAENYGLKVIPIGPGNTERQIRFLIDFKVNSFISISNYIPIMIEYMRMHDIDPKKEMRLKAIFIGAEPFNPIEKKKWSEFFGVPILGIYGMSEIEGPGIAYEEAGLPGMCICTDDFYVEILDPYSGKVLPIGSEGEIVVTTLRREAMPLLRFRTGDISRLIRDSSKNGIRSIRLDYVTHRIDDMVIIKGVNIFPDEMERIIHSFSEIYHFFEMVVAKNDEMKIRLSLRDVGSDISLIEKHLESEIKKWLFINVSVEWMPVSYFMEKNGKRISVIDNRK